MKKKLLTIVLCMSSLAMLAQSRLVVNTASGSQEKFALETKPTVTFNVQYGRVGVTVGGRYKELDIKSLQFENLPANASQWVVINVDGEKVMVPIATLKSIVVSAFDEHANHLPKAIASDASVSIYNEALKATHMADSLMRYMDATYGFLDDESMQDSCYWNNNNLVYHISTDYDNVAFPKQRLYKYTVLLVPDAVLKEKYAITSLDGLRAKAHELYDPMYPEDKSVTDETDRRNALNRFISYHLLPFYGEYYTLTAFDNGRLQYNFDRQHADITDWYETLMPHSLMKFSFPEGTEEGLYVNRRGVTSKADDRGVFVRGAKVKAEQTTHTAENGIYHYIDDIVAYDQQMQQVVCNDRMRLDCTTLSPDFLTSGARGHHTRVSADDGMYGQISFSPWASENPNTCLGFKAGSATNFYFTDYYTHVHVRNRYPNFWSYQGDEVFVKGRFDVKIKLPTLPAGKYELRLGTVVNFASRGIINLYIDDDLVGDHVDFRLSGTTPISPYAYSTEQTYTEDGRVTRYYPSNQELAWIDLSLPENIQEKMLEANESGWGISPLWSTPIKEDFLEYEEREITDAELMEMFKEEVINQMFKNNDKTLYRNVAYYWRQVQNNPNQYVFEGDEPLPPDSEEMKAYYDNLIDWDAFFKMGAVRYFDKVLHDRGWMRGAGDYAPGDRDAFGGTTMRGLSIMRRRVVGTFETDGKTDHYLRLQQQEASGGEIPLDYIELIPVSLIENENIY